MPAEDEAVQAVVRIGAEAVTSTADVIKYLLQLVLAREGRGKAGDGLLWRTGHGVVRLGKNVLGCAWDKWAHDRDGRGRVGQVSWRRALGWDDLTTFSISKDLADPENLNALRKELVRFGVTFAMDRASNGDTLIAYHLSHRELLNSIASPLLRSWAAARGVDPSDDKAICDELVKSEVAAGLEDARDIVSRAREIEDSPAPQPAVDVLEELAEIGAVDRGSVEALGDSPTMGDVEAVALGSPREDDSRTQPRSASSQATDFEAARAAGPAALFGAIAAEDAGSIDHAAQKPAQMAPRAAR